MRRKQKQGGLTKVSSVLALDGLEQIFELEQEQVKWDFNLSRLPYFVCGDKPEDRYRNIELAQSIEIDGKKVETVWEVRHDFKLGLPGSFDRDVWIGILQLVLRETGSGRPVPDVIDLGSAYGFLKAIGKSANGQYARMLRESIERLATTGCLSKGSFNCPSSGGYVYMAAHEMEE